MKCALLLFSFAFLCSRGVSPQTVSSQQPACLLCKVASYDIQFDSDEAADALVCITDAPYDKGGSGVGYFRLSLPEDFVQAHEQDILSGDFKICIEGGVASRANYTVSYPENATISVLPQLTNRAFVTSRASGDLTLLAVRVTSRAGEDPGLTAVEIEGAVFGTGLNASDPNVTAQYEACSAGNLRFRAPTGNGIVNGVLDVVVDGPFEGGDMIGTLQSSIIAAVEAAVGSTSQFSKIMLCVPTGSNIPGAESTTGGVWSAFGHINGDVSIFQNENCGRISATIHEIGHNIGFYHSSKGDDVYGDHSCYMGVGYRAFRWPKQCFNGHKSWIAGWYANQQIAIDPATNGAYSGRLVALVEWNNPGFQAGSDVVLINVQDLYILFNRRIGANIESQDAHDMVTVTQGAPTRSYNLAILNASQSFTYAGNGTTSSIVIEVCSIVMGETLDYALVSIYVAGSQSSTCSSTGSSPATLEPSAAPSPLSTTVTVAPPTTWSPTTVSPDTFPPTTVSQDTFPPTTVSPDTFPPTPSPPPPPGSTLPPPTAPAASPVSQPPSGSTIPPPTPTTVASPPSLPPSPGSSLPPPTAPVSSSSLPPSPVSPLTPPTATSPVSTPSPGSTVVTQPTDFLPTSSFVTPQPSAQAGTTTTSPVGPTTQEPTVGASVSPTTSTPKPVSTAPISTEGTAQPSIQLDGGTTTLAPVAEIPTSTITTNAPSPALSPTVQPSTSPAPTVPSNSTLQPSTSPSPTFQISNFTSTTMEPSNVAFPTVQPSTSPSPTAPSSKNTSPDVKPTSNTSPDVKPTSNTSPDVKPTSSTSPDVKPTSNTSPDVKPSNNTSAESNSTSPTLSPPNSTNTTGNTSTNTNSTNTTGGNSTNPRYPSSAPITAPPYLFQVSSLSATSWAAPSYSSTKTTTVYLLVAWVAWWGCSIRL